MDYDSPMELTDSAPVTTPETPSPEAPAKVEDPAADPTPPAAEEPLYDLPDGRKVNAESLQKEWKDNFLPEFTRKSQALAEIERKKDLSGPDEPAWKSPDYVPENYAEVIELAKREAINEIQGSYQAEQNRIKAVQSTVDTEISELKKTDPKLDENALFVHANKYGFRDLKAAHTNMVDMRKAIVDVEQRTVKNLKTREADLISTGAGAELPDTGGYDPKSMSQFESATEYLNFIKGKK